MNLKQNARLQSFTTDVLMARMKACRQLLRIKKRDFLKNFSKYFLEEIPGKAYFC